MPGENLDEEYHRYLWGESSPRSFASKAKLGTKERVSRIVVVDASFDVSKFVPR